MVLQNYQNFKECLKIIEFTQCSKKKNFPTKKEFPNEKKFPNKKK